MLRLWLIDSSHLGQLIFQVIPGISSGVHGYVGGGVVLGSCVEANLVFVHLHVQIVLVGHYCHSLDGSMLEFIGIGVVSRWHCPNVVFEGFVEDG